MFDNMSNSERPQKFHCYECLNNYDCDPDGTRTCKIEEGGTRCDDNQPDFPYLTGMPGAGYGYNIFKADPMLLTKNSKDISHDTGIPDQPFFHLTPQYKPALLYNGVEYSVPNGFIVTILQVDITSAQTKTLSSSEAVETASSSYAKVEASGTINGIDIGGGLGVSAFEKTKKSFESLTTLTSSKREQGLYKFVLSEGNDLKLHSHTERALQLLTNSGSEVEWYNFFEEFGTHLTPKGIMGRIETVSYSFSSSEREEIAAKGKSFDLEVKAGITGLFAAKAGTGGDQMSATSKRIAEINSETAILRLGGRINTDDTPVIIKRLSLKPICKYIPYNKYVVDEDNCKKMMLRYCKKKLGEAGLNNDECKYIDEFECADHRDCGYDEEHEKYNRTSVECVAGKCVHWKIGNKGKSCTEKCTSIGAECKVVKTTTMDELKFRAEIANPFPEGDAELMVEMCDSPWSHGVCVGMEMNYNMYATWKTQLTFNPASDLYTEKGGYYKWILGDKTPDCDATFLNRYGLCACA